MNAERDILDAIYLQTRACVEHALKKKQKTIFVRGTNPQIRPINQIVFFVKGHVRLGRVFPILFSGKVSEDETHAAMKQWLVVLISSKIVCILLSNSKCISPLIR